MLYQLTSLRHVVGSYLQAGYVDYKHIHVYRYNKVFSVLAGHYEKGNVEATQLQIFGVVTPSLIGYAGNIVYSYYQGNLTFCIS